MKEEDLFKIRKYLLYTAFILSVIIITYVLVYPVGYLPNGYHVIAQTEKSITVQKHTALGLKEKTVVYQPEIKEDIWKIDRLKDKIENQKGYFHIFFSSILVSFLWIVKDIWQGRRLVVAILASSSGVVFSGISLLQEIGSIQGYLL